MTRDTRNNLENGVWGDEPATAHVNGDGPYVGRNDRTGDVVQATDRANPNLKSPFQWKLVR